MAVITSKLLKLNNGRSIPRLGFGLYLTPPGEAINLTYQALKHGFRHIDSAESYQNELEAVKGIKKWIDEDPQNNKREDVRYTTKIKNKLVTYDGVQSSIKERVEIAKQHIGYIDLVLLHSPLTDKEGRLGAWKKLQEYITEHPDDVKSIGVSNYGVKHLKELFEWDGFKINPVVNQIELNPWLTHADIVEYAKLHDVHIEAFSPLTRQTRLNDPEVSKYAKKYGKTNAQILLRWSIQKGFVPLVKTVHVERIPENLDIWDFELSTEDVKALSHDDEYYLADESWDPTVYKDDK